MAGSISGSVVLTDGLTPVAGALVFGSTSEGMSAGDRPWASLEVTAVTDRAGRFTFDELREGDWWLWARGAHGDLLGKATVRVLGNALSDVTITLGAPRSQAGTDNDSGARGSDDDDAGTNAPGAPEPPPQGSVRGRVVRAVDGLPLGSATVMVLHGSGSAPDIAALTDDRGGFVFDGLPPGD